MYVPSRADFCAAAREGNLLPVYREIVADGDTPVSAYAKLCRSDYSFLLESVVGAETWAAYSFIGVAPRAVMRCRGGRVSVDWYDVDGGGGAVQASWEAADPTAAVADVMAEFRPVAAPGLPRFWGGAVGWIGYDAVRAFEDLPARAPDDLGLPEVYVVLTDTLVIFDNLRQTVKIVATPYVPRPERAERAYEGALARIDALVERLGEAAGTDALAPLAAPPPGETGSAALRWGGSEEPRSSTTRETFEASVAKMKDYIVAGDVFQGVLSQRFEVPRMGIDSFDVYRALRVVNPSPYMYHLRFPEAQVTGASPEALVRAAGGRVEVRPIAGTRPRGSTPEEDEALAEDLRADPKEVAEHLMLVDLGRNDVGRVARTGTVRATELMTTERYSHVIHMTSHVVGELAQDRSWHDVLKAVFPTGTLTGAPKVRAMEIIDELEPHRRGVYGGAVGYISYAGNMDVAIAIRTLLSTDDAVYVQAGCGVVHDSDPAAEYEETVNKARAVLRAVSLARKGGP